MGVQAPVCVAAKRCLSATSQRTDRCAALVLPAGQGRQIESARRHQPEAHQLFTQRADGGRVRPARIRHGVLVRAVGPGESAERTEREAISRSAKAVRAKLAVERLGE